MSNPSPEYHAVDPHSPRIKRWSKLRTKIQEPLKHTLELAIKFPPTLEKNPRFFSLLRGALWGALGLYFLLGFFVLSVRYGVLPYIENYRSDIEKAISKAVKQPVHIRTLQGEWVGLRPRINIKGIEIHSPQGKTLLALEHVVAEPAWNSLLHGELRLARLEFISPSIVISRDKAGHFFAANLDITPQENDGGGFAHWLFTQHSIIIRHATLSWQDSLREAPPLVLKNLNFRLENKGELHEFGLTAEPPSSLASKLDIRGDLHGDDLKQLSSWHGKTYVEIKTADLAGWHAWIDYPVPIPQGTGALRLWVDFSQTQIKAVTADVSLANVSMQLQPNLPDFDLKQLTGRLSATRLADGFSVESKKLMLATQQGLILPSTDITMRWQNGLAADTTFLGLDLSGLKSLGQSKQQPKPHGRFIANQLDLGVIAQIANYLPLPVSTRIQLLRYAPSGQIADLSLVWQGPFDNLQEWSLNSSLKNLTLRGLGTVESFSGINGHIAGTNQSGTLQLNGKNSHISLPSIFSEPNILLNTLAAELKWNKTPQGFRINLTQANFSNQDAAGEASGTWQSLPKGPGQIDLTARLTRGNGNAVWRYIPLVVSQHTRDWLKNGILSGTVNEANLVLKGDLTHFPFKGGPSKNKGGLFEVRGKFQDAKLNYTDNWPVITDINGELLFAGERMLISGHSGRIFDVDLRDVRAEIKDLSSIEELLTVTGKAKGSTADFLRYINNSGVGERLGHITESMTAKGIGELDLVLNLPLRDLDQSRIAGQYKVDNNQLNIDQSFPPLTNVRGVLKFSESHLEAKEIRGLFLDLPIAANLKSLNGSVQVNLVGDITPAKLRQRWPHPILDHFSGRAQWQGNLKIKNKTIDATITSNLVGISSSLPEPFNKSSKDPLNLTFERRTLPHPLTGKTTESSFTPIPRDQIDVRIGSIAQLQLVRRQDVSPPLITQGMLALGGIAPSSAPQQVVVAVNLPKLNADAWRSILMASPNSDPQSTSPSLPKLPPYQFDLRIADLTLFDNTLHDVRITGEQIDATTRGEIKSRELSGKAAWLDTGKGKLTANLDKFALPESFAQSAKLQASTRTVRNDLPALDIRVDELSFKKQSLGRLTLTAESRDAAWNTLINLKNENDNLTVKGRWKNNDSKSDTQLDFAFDSTAIEKTLVRLGYPEFMQSKRIHLDGQLRWQGDPLAINYPSLNGFLSINTDQGQIKDLDPGAGRLLGILNFQTLIRRITLDFRDLFGKGFAFDKIKGGFTLDKGIMNTTDLQIRAPSAKILFDGQINLINETQDIHAEVQPALGESVAVGTMIVSPIAGAAVWAAQKILRDPFGQVFAMDYQITGSLANPKIDSTRRARSPQSSSAEKTVTKPEEIKDAP